MKLWAMQPPVCRCQSNSGLLLAGVNMEKNKLSFEEAYKQLTELVKKMESGEMPLADSVTAYEQGIKLKAYCEQMLKEAELKIETLKVGAQQ